MVVLPMILYTNDNITPPINSKPLFLSHTNTHKPLATPLTNPVVFNWIAAGSIGYS